MRSFLTTHNFLLLFCSLFTTPSLCVAIPGGSDPAAFITAAPIPVPASTPAAPLQSPFIDPSSPPANYLTLTLIRNVLERMEDLIIFALIQRSQYPYDPALYLPHGKSPSALKWFLEKEEGVLALTGQWQLPDQVPFTSLQKLPQPIYSPLPSYPTVLNGSASQINLNKALKRAYLNSTLPSLNLTITTTTPSPVPGPTLNTDASVLHLLSSRIYLGRYVAESKYVSNSTAFADPIRTRNTTMLNLLVTNRTVEDANVQRVQLKAVSYGAPSEAVGGLYRDVLIPLTKEVEVSFILSYLF
ncbi:hypothetical protein CF326_g3872 [Tilletia indica]|nr:hypothetical protein CF326_g3872 [Tilletia indica]